MRHCNIQAAFLSDWDAQDFGLPTILPQHRRPDKATMCA